MSNKNWRQEPRDKKTGRWKRGGPKKLPGVKASTSGSGPKVPQFPKR